MSDLRTAAKMGELATNLCFQAKAIPHIIDTVPSLFMIYMCLNQPNQAVSLLNRLYLNSKVEHGVEDLTWYYALAMDFLLITGHTIESFETCKKFCTHEILSNGKIVNESQLRLVVNLLEFISRTVDKAEDDAQVLKNLLASAENESSFTLDHKFTLLRMYELGYHKLSISNMMKDFPEFLKVQQKWQMLREKPKIPSLKMMEKLKEEASKHQNYQCLEEIVSYQIMHKENSV